MLDDVGPHHVPYVDDDEILFRRILNEERAYNSKKDPPLSPDAFHPNKHDDTGISLDRAYSEKNPQFKTLEQAATGRNPKGYYVAIFCVADLRAHGIQVSADPKDGNPGHAELPELRHEERKSPRADYIKELLAEKLCLRVEGPFLPD